MKDLRTTRKFQGVIGPMLARSGWFRPVAKDYRKQKQEFVLVNRLSGRTAGDVSIMFAPTIRLATDRTDSKIDLTRIFSAHSVTRQFSSTYQTKIREILSSVFSTFGRTVREITRSTTNERISPAKAQRRKENPEVFLGALAPLREKFSVTTTRAVDHFKYVAELKLFTSSKKTDSHQHHDRWLLLRSKNTEREVESPSTTNLFTTLSLNFASPKVSETELVQQQIARFASSPELTYPKRQQAMSEGVVQALRSLRAPEPEPKRAPAPAPLPSIEQITNQVKTQLERELRIERERRGL